MSKQPTRSGYLGAAEPMLKVAVFLSLLIVFVLPIVISSKVAGVAQGYQSTDPSLQTGMVVRLSSDSTPSSLLVEPTDSESSTPPLGVASQVTNNLLNVGSASNNVFITSSGKASAYVSDIAGAIKKGDLLAVSPLKGVLQKAGAGSQLSVGSALEYLPDTAQATTVKGSKKTTRIGLISVNVDIKAIGQSQANDDFLQSFGRSVTGHSINQVRVLAAFVIFIVLLIVEGVVIHATVTSTISAAGRNPMARGVIEQQSIKGVLIAVVVLLSSIATIAIILWA